MENKVIIGLDEYLELRDRVQKMEQQIEKIGKIVVVKEDKGYYVDPAQDPFGRIPKFRRDVIVKKKDLENYICNILGFSWCDLKIIEEDNNDRKN